MKKIILLSITLFLVAGHLCAQTIKLENVPSAVKTTFLQKYPMTTKVYWEKEKGNFEANWGGKSNEDNSAVFSPDGTFIEIVKSIPVSQLPKNVAVYVKEHYKSMKIKEAGKITDASGKTMYEAETKIGDLIFDENGAFLKRD